MTIGTKEYYVNEFKQTLMTNFVTGDAQSLASVHADYEEQIGDMPTLNADEKIGYLQNLEKAFNAILHEVLGQSEEE